MNHRYVVFDVETPNVRNDRMSAIGITVIENMKIVDEYYELVNPETSFNDFNIALTGITPEAVADKPTFGELWEEIQPIMEEGILIAHNAPFDMSVLAKCLRDYGIYWRRRTPYACTCRMSREALVGLENYRLNTITDFLHISLQHHNAGSDSRACAEVLLYCLEHGVNCGDFCRTYDFKKVKTLPQKKKAAKAE